MMPYSLDMSVIGHEGQLGVEIFARQNGWIVTSPQNPYVHFMCTSESAQIQSDQVFKANHAKPWNGINEVTLELT